MHQGLTSKLLPPVSNFTELFIHASHLDRRWVYRFFMGLQRQPGCENKGRTLDLPFSPLFFNYQAEEGFRTLNASYQTKGQAANFSKNNTHHTHSIGSLLAGETSSSFSRSLLRCQLGLLPPAGWLEHQLSNYISSPVILSWQESQLHNPLFA